MLDKAGTRLARPAWSSRLYPPVTVRVPRLTVEFGPRLRDKQLVKVLWQGLSRDRDRVL
jgi:hypothetical protein